MYHDSREKSYCGFCKWNENPYREDCHIVLKRDCDDSYDMPAGKKKSFIRLDKRDQNSKNDCEYYKYSLARKIRSFFD